MKKRVYFEKLEEMKYISNLDLLRFLERLFKITNIKLEYSKGFNPRPKISFGNPISIGEEAYYEPFDIDLVEDMDSDEILNRLNAKVPKGFKVLQVEDRVTKGSITKDFSAIEYNIVFEENKDKNLFESLLNQKEILEKKEKRGKVKERNLKEKVVSYGIDGNKISLILDNISPNAYFRMVDIDMSKVIIRRMRYVNI